MSLGIGTQIECCRSNFQISFNGINAITDVTLFAHFDFAPVVARSIAISVSVSLLVCLCSLGYVNNRVSQILPIFL